MKNRLSALLHSAFRPSILTAVIFALFAVASAFAEEIDLQGRYLEYDDAAKYIVATGSVTVTWEGKVLKAEKVQFWTEKKFLVANDNVTLFDGTSTIKAQSMTYDYAASSGSVLRSSGTLDEWYFSADRLVRVSGDRYLAEGMDATTCDLPEPHYHLRVSRAKITLNRRITVYNAVFYLRNVPVFYLPIWSQGIGSSTYSLDTQFGYNSEDGFIIKNTLTYPFNKRSYGKLYLDYFSNGGWGEGAEYDYYIPNKVKATAYGYHLRKNYLDTEYWHYRLSHWYRINSEWTSRSDIDFIHNTTYDNQRLFDDWRLLGKEINSTLSFTRQTRLNNLQISASRYDVYDSTAAIYRLKTVTLPAIDFTQYSLMPKSRYKSTLSMSFSNKYDNEFDTYTWQGYVNANISRGYSFFRRRMTVTPTLGISETWTSVSVPGDVATSTSAALVTRYYAMLNTRYYLNRDWLWDVGYRYRLRSKPNTLLYDQYSEDFGEEENKLYFLSQYSLRRLTLRTSSGYDFRVTRTELNTPTFDYMQKYDPLVNELTWAPMGMLSLYVRDERNIYPSFLSLRSFQTIVNYGMMERTYGSFGVFFNNISGTDELGVNAGFGLWVNPKWRLDYRVNTRSTSYSGQWQPVDQELKIYRDLHCWELKIGFRRRLTNIGNYVDEIAFFQIGLKTGAQHRRAVTNERLEKEFYPWR